MPASRLKWPDQIEASGPLRVPSVWTSASLRGEHSRQRRLLGGALVLDCDRGILSIEASRAFTMPFTIVAGSYHALNYSPDGDTVRFAPERLETLSALGGAPPRLNARNHASLRLEG